MTTEKMELLNLLIENDNPEQAVLTAASIILGLLKPHESSEEPISACL